MANNTGRKPVQVEMAGGKTQRQRMWEAIRALHKAGKTITQDDVIRLARIHYDGTANTYFRCLVKAGIISRHEGETLPGRGAVKAKAVYILEKDLGCEAPRVNKQGEFVTQGSGTESMWRTMRIIGQFTPAQLAVMASTEEVKVNESTAKVYCATLARAGYLKVERQGKGTGKGGIPTLYRFLPAKYTGPRAPMIQSVKTVYDPNTHQVVWQPTPDEILEEADHVA